MGSLHRRVPHRERKNMDKNTGNKIMFICRVTMACFFSFCIILLIQIIKQDRLAYKENEISSKYEAYMKDTTLNADFPTPQTNLYTQNQLSEAGVYDYSKEDAWEARKQVLQNALQYVGMVYYDPKHHGDKLLYGSKNDASGFVSQIYSNVLDNKIYSNPALYIKFADHISMYDSTEIRPGDILLHGKGGNTLIYLGELNGKKAIIDCSKDVAKIRYPGDFYLQSCDYIDMYQPLMEMYQ